MGGRGYLSCQTPQPLVCGSSFSCPRSIGKLQWLIFKKYFIFVTPFALRAKKVFVRVTREGQQPENFTIQYRATPVVLDATIGRKNNPRATLHKALGPPLISVTRKLGLVARFGADGISFPWAGQQLNLRGTL